MGMSFNFSVNRLQSLKKGNLEFYKSFNYGQYIAHLHEDFYCVEVVSIASLFNNLLFFFKCLLHTADWRLKDMAVSKNPVNISLRIINNH